MKYEIKEKSHYIIINMAFPSRHFVLNILNYIFYYKLLEYQNEVSYFDKGNCW